MKPVQSDKIWNAQTSLTNIVMQM